MCKEVQITKFELYHSFNGNPHYLENFVHSITLLESFAQGDDIEVLKLFVMSNLTGRALRAVSANEGTIADIKNSLRNIKRILR